MKSERLWLAEMLDLALDLGIVVPTDLLGHVSTTQLAKSLPREELARLLAAGLSEAVFAPQTVVDALGVVTLVQHVRTSDIWAAIRDGVERAVGADTEERTVVKAAPTAPPKAEFLPAPTPAPAHAASPAPEPSAAPAPAPSGPPPRLSSPRRSATMRGPSVSPGAVRVTSTSTPRTDATEQGTPPPADADLDEVLVSLEGDPEDGPTSSG